ncbi:MAG TPA: hypothetical protein PK566_15815 [Pseudobacteroides sp.]|nr:hypothetical protein [Pseudobacteroides sp.]
MKKRITLAFILLVVLLFQNIVFAHTYGYRWNYINIIPKYTTPGSPMQKQLLMQSYGVDIGSDYTSAFYWAKKRWNDFSDKYIYITDSSYATSTIDVRTGYWDPTWPANGYGATERYITNNNITYAAMYINPNTTANFSFENKTKVFIHEFGHCAGLEDTNDGTVTVMRQGKWSDFGYGSTVYPQAHDRSDLASYYPY